MLCRKARNITATNRGRYFSQAFALPFNNWMWSCPPKQRLSTASSMYSTFVMNPVAWRAKSFSPHHQPKSIRIDIDHIELCACHQSPTTPSITARSTTSPHKDDQRELAHFARKQTASELQVMLALPQQTCHCVYLCVECLQLGECQANRIEMSKCGFSTLNFFWALTWSASSPRSRPNQQIHRHSCTQTKSTSSSLEPCWPVRFSQSHSTRTERTCIPLGLVHACVKRSASPCS